MQEILSFKEIQLKREGHIILDGVSGSLGFDSKVALVGSNGAGKTTLFRILKGEEFDYTGGVVMSGKVANVPQLNLEHYQKEQPLYEYLMGVYENWWEVLAKCEELFDLNLSEVDMLSTLSGGELAKLHIALAYAQNPELILFDEPTNHLDLPGLNKLAEVLRSQAAAFMIISHNTHFLDRVTNETWVLREGKLAKFGGNYSFYLVEKKKLEEVQQRQLEVAQKELRRSKQALVQHQEYHQKSKAKLRRAEKSGNSGIPKIFRNEMRKKGEAVFGKTKTRLTAEQEALQDKAKQLRPQRRRTIKPLLGHENIGERLIFQLTNFDLQVAGKILQRGLNLDVYGGDHLAIIGANGSGKSCLLKVVHERVPKSLLISQKYDFLDPDASLTESLQWVNPSLSYEEQRAVLASLGFPREADVVKKVSSLSGGELARLGFAVATSSTAELLLLDEPNNNLDPETLADIVAALKSYSGALIVVSHDLGFLEQLEIEKYLRFSKNL